MIRLLLSISTCLILFIFLVISTASATESQKLVVGGDHDCPPYEFVENGNPTGFDIELMRAVAEVMGFDVEFRLGPWNKARHDLEQGKIDALAGMYYSADRSRRVDFSVPHTMVSSGIFVRKNSAIRSFSDVRGKEIIVQEGDVINDFLVKNDLASRIVVVTDAVEGLRLLASGKYDCAIIPSKLQGEYYVKKFGLTNLKSINSGLAQLRYCFAVQKGRRELLYKLDEGLNILKVNGKYQEIYEKWFGIYEKNNLWKTLRYYVLALSLIAALFIASLLWSRSLQKQVRIRTAELRRNEEELRNSHTELELRVKERTAELTTVNEHLKASEAEKSLILNNTLAHVVYHDPDMKILWANQAAGDSVNMALEELKGRYCWEVWHQRNEPCEGCPVLLAKDTGQPQQGEIRSPDGRVWFIRGYPIKNEKGRLLGLTEFTQDITEHRRTEEALRESELRYREVFENSSECIFLVDVTADGRFKFAGFNPAEEKTVGFSNAEVFGKFIEEVISAELACQVITNYRRCLEAGTIINYDEEFDLPLGRRYFHTVLIPVRNVVGDIYRIVGVARDITERKRMEVELQHAHDKLEKRVAERTDQLRKAIDILHDEIVERQKTEKALRKSEERYTLAVDGANDGIWERDLLTGEVYFSPRWKNMLGYEDHEIPNHFFEWKKRIHPDDCELVININRAYLNAYIPTYEIEYRLQHKDGSYRWIHTRGSCLRDPYGMPYRIAGSHTDITPRKIADQLRRQNETLLETVLETMPVGIWILGKNGFITLSNEAARRIWADARYVGIDQYDEYKGWWHHTGKRIEKEEWAAVRAIRKGETSLGEIIDIECFDGSRKTIVNSAVPLRNEKGEIFAAVIVNEDVTERKRAEKSLIESEKKYRTLFEESKDTIFVSDTARRFIDINRAGLELTGYERDEHLSLDPALLYSNPEDRKWLWQEVDSSGFVNDYETQIKRKDGERSIVQLSVSSIKDVAGQITGYQGIVRDVTERKKLEQQLLQAQKMESIGVLAGGVAHDFNNLLTGISGYGQILQESIPADDELSKESIEQVLKAAERASELTRSLLAVSRKQIINPKPIYIDTIISNTSKLVKRIIGEDIDFNIAFSDKNLLVKADAGQIEQVLMNLATNARDAMPNGGSLSISTKRVVVKEAKVSLCDLSLPGKYALISISDTGSGIDKKSMERLFEPFYTTKEVGKGTGLGLSIVHGIIKQHDGSILVSSELGKGTTFRIYLPLIDDFVVGDQSNIPSPLAGGTETLLIVEDEEVVRVFLKRILERSGYKVILAGDGEQAVERFKEHHDISLVLSDVVMPKKNGKVTLEEIKRIKPGIKTVFISGYTADIMHSKGILEKDVDFLAKPCSKSDVLRKVREVLDRC